MAISRINSRAILDGSVVAAEVADGAITPAKLQTATDFTVNGLTVGKGAGAVATNTVVGASTLSSNTSGSRTTAIGSSVGANLTTGARNTLIGNNILATATTSVDNVMIGDYVGRAYTGSSSVAIGAQALGNGTSNSGDNLIAIGQGALNSNAGGANNTAVGASALTSNTTASNNTAVGYQALYNNTGGNGTTAATNTAIGYQALYSNSIGYGGVSIGYQAGYTNSTGALNTFLGNQAGYSTTSSNNTFLGATAGYAVTSGAKNTIIGEYNGNQGGLDIRTSSNYIVLSDGDGNPRVVVNGSGSVGVGTTTPTAANSGSLFTVASSTARGGNLVISKVNSGTANQNGQYLILANEGPANTGRNSGVEAGRLYFQFSQPTSGALQDAGAISVESSTASGGQSGGVTQSDMIFYTTGASSTMSERMRINYLGYVGISTSSTTSCFEVAGEGAQPYGQYVYVNSPNSGYGGLGILGVNCARTATSGIGLAQFRSANTLVCQIRGDGSIVNTGGSYGTISDAKLKENIVDATPKLDDLMQLKVRNFNLKTESNQQTHKQIGFVAQELEEIFPALIDTVDDKDDEGNELGTTTKSVKTSVLIPILVKAIQELKAEFDEYKRTHP
jgi:trimeric autotransporter adhesin